MDKNIFKDQDDDNIYKAPKTLSVEIADHITERIIKGKYQKGYQLKILDLSKEYSASQTTIREALQILQRSDLVKILPRKGAFIRGLEKEEINDIWDIKIRLWSLAFKYFILRNSEEVLNQLILIGENLIKAAQDKDYESVYNYNFDWATYCISNCKSEKLDYLLYNIELQVKRYRYQSIHFDNNLEKTREYFSLFITVIKNKNINNAEKYISEFIEMDKQILLNNFDKLI